MSPSVVQASRLFFLLITASFFTGAFSAHGQDVDHWESVVYESDTWRYLVPTAEPGSDWRLPAFDDSTWPEGVGGFGYGDDDDATVLDNADVVFTRITFSIADTSKIASAILHVDYDDGFVAFINGVEVARAGVGVVGDRPRFDTFSSSLHEAAMYTGGQPAGFTFTKEKLEESLVNGDNVLAVQVHNDNANSSDLSLRTFFSVGLTEAGSVYRPTPDWFVAPITSSSDFVSRLPLISIDTQGQIIPDEPKIIARMGVVDNGPGNLNSLADPFNHYDGFVGIEVRGSSSQAIFPKKSYAVETRADNLEDQDVALLGLPEEEDWVFHGPYSDKSLMRNVLIYHLANRMGRYAPRTRFAEVFINDVYQGVYVVMERIKRDKNRVDISKLNPDEVSGDDLTGGYIIKIDKTTGAEVGGWQSPHAPKPGYTQRIFYQYHYPKPSEIVPEQEAYIQQVVADFENAMLAANFADPVEGYSKYIDVGSAIDFFILNEIARNVDGYRLSTFLHKEKDSEGDGKLIFGPLWDFNLGFGNADYYGGGQESGFQAEIGVPQTDGLQPPFWWKKLWQEPSFNARVAARWDSLRQEFLHTDSLMHFMDENLSQLEEAPTRNFDKWRILGTYVWPNRFVGNTFTQEINYMKDWIAGRMRWIDSNLSGVSLPTDALLPATTFELSDPFPNPMFNEGNITLTVGRRQQVRIEVYDLTGRLVLLPFDDFQDDNTSRTYTFSRASLASGVYLIRALGSSAVTSKKLVIR